MAEGRPFCYYVPIDSHVPGKGYRPSVVFKDVAGHFPNGGGETAPWYWGGDFKAALEICKEKNLEGGVSPEEAEAIVNSSIEASIMEGVAR
jgi:hypothetical protein